MTVNILKWQKMYNSQDYGLQRKSNNTVFKTNYQINNK